MFSLIQYYTTNENAAAAGVTRQNPAILPINLAAKASAAAAAAKGSSLAHDLSRLMA